MQGVVMRAGCVKAIVSVTAIASLAAPWALAEDSVMRPDGTEIRYQLDIPAERIGSPLVVVAQGSGCAGARRSEAVRSVIDAFAGLPVLTVEAYGVVPDHGDPAHCTDDFTTKGTMSQRLADYQQVLATFDGADWWDGRIILFGGSEGGLVMARLAARVEAEAAILLSTAPGATFAEIVLAGVPPEGRETVTKMFDLAQAEPESMEMFAGYPLRFWADAIEFRAIDEMLASATQFLVIHGGQDGVPADYARSAASSYATAKRCELTYWEFPGLDHGMTDLDGETRMPDVVASAAAWAFKVIDRPDC